MLAATMYGAEYLGLYATIIITHINAIMYADTLSMLEVIVNRTTNV
jgi:hypothetical protein